MLDRWPLAHIGTDLREHHLSGQHVDTIYLRQDKTTRNKDIENTNQTILTTPFPYLCSDPQSSTKRHSPELCLKL